MSPTATKSRSRARLVHLAGCPKDRIETFTNEGPGGAFKVTRCTDCGVQSVQSADLAAFHEQWAEGINDNEEDENDG